MDFIKLNAVNFLTIGNSGDIHLKNRGLNLIQGANADDTSALSNGAGKSSIPDALCWALYGTTARGESGDSVINDKAGKECAVLVEVEDGSATYSITRFRKHKTGKNSVTVQVVNGMGLMVLTKGTDKETQLVINDILGCTYEVFKAAIYAGQEDMPDIPKMRDRALKNLIEEAAGVQKLEKAYEVAKGRATISTRVVETNEVQIDRNKGAIAAAQVELEGAKLRHVAFEEARKVRIAVQVAAADKAKADAHTAVAQLQALGEGAVTSQLASLEGALSSGEVARIALQKHRAEKLVPLGNALAVEGSKRERMLLEAGALCKRFENAVSELDKPCPECAKPHTADELEHLKGVIKAQFEAKRADVVAQTTKFTKLKYDQGLLLAEEQALQAAIPDVSAVQSQSSVLLAQLSAITKLKGVARAFVTASQTALSMADLTRKEANPQDTLIASCTAKIDMLSTHIDTLNADLVKERRTMEIDAAVASVYSPAGVRAHILDTVTPFLNDRTGEYLGTLSDGNLSAVWSTLSRTAKGELREKFVIDVEHQKGGKSFGLISGGEKRKVRLACMLALQDLVASRATKPLNLWLGDEIDDALDTPGIERLMTILERKAREKGTVLVISHNDIGDWCDQITTVTKSGGVSSVAGALCELY